MLTTSGTFGATGSSGQVSGKNCWVKKTGAATATVDVQYLGPDGVWVVHTAALADDTPTFISVALNVPWRLNCSAYTSGTVTYTIAAGN